MCNVYGADGEVVGTRELVADIFNREIKEGLVHLAVVAQAANARTVIADTKSRGEVRGGGKKPWRQKGTGRARHGSIRSPIWRGGGITFGPRTDRNYALKINKKAKKNALCMVLSDKARQQNIILIDTGAFHAQKTKEALALLKKLPLQLDEKRKKQHAIGCVTPAGSTVASRGFRNIPFAHLLPVNSLNIIDVLNMKKLVMPLASLDMIERTYAKK
ncbi:50S ribosomal protein L4 [Candidatus Uhrbacteria bacterium]|nr:50S ribosomal protein L4 [Candidatus Uhrbacteria bacterium]